jgi:hypothetical protein
MPCEKHPDAPVGSGRAACRECQHEYARHWYQQNKARKQAQNRAWKQANRETYLPQQRAYAVAYRAENKEALRAHWAWYRKEHRAQLRERDKRRYWDNRDAELARGRDYKARNPEKVRARDQRRTRRGRPDRAIRDGKSSPICRRVGFALVRILNAPRVGCQSARFRAARLDKLLDPGERAIAHFQIVAGCWVCLPPPLRIAGLDAELLQRLMLRHQKAGLP